jgi:hypothetical protein
MAPPQKRVATLKGIRFFPCDASAPGEKYAKIALKVQMAVK